MIKQFSENGPVGVLKPCCTTADAHTRALTARHPIKPTSPRCPSAWQPNPGRRSTYRRGKTVQTTGATSKMPTLPITSPSPHERGRSASHRHRIAGGQHVQVADPDALVGRVDHDVERLPARRPQHHPVAHRHHVVQVGFAAVCLRGCVACTRPDGCPAPGGRARRGTARHRSCGARRNYPATDRSSLRWPICPRSEFGR